MSEHDASYKQLFSNPLMVRSLFEGVLQAASPDMDVPEAHEFDWEGAESLPTSFVTKGMRQRNSDCLWRIPRKAGPDLHLILLLEFQSTNDAHMALRVTIYVLLLYDALIKQGKISPSDPYPTVLPVVLYNGVKPWTAATRLSQKLRPTAPWRALVPNGGYILVDEGQLLAQGLVPEAGLMSLLIRLEHCPSIEQFQELVQTVIKQTVEPAYAPARHSLLEWIKNYLWRRNVPDHSLGHIRNFEELTTMLMQERMSWTDKIRIEGHQEGAANLLERLLLRKFGPLSPAIQQRIESATSAEIEIWSLAILDATTLDDVFSGS